MKITEAIRKVHLMSNQIQMAVLFTTFSMVGGFAMSLFGILMIWCTTMEKGWQSLMCYIALMGCFVMGMSFFTLLSHLLFETMRLLPQEKE